VGTNLQSIEDMFVHSVFNMLILRTSEVFNICVPTLKVYRTILLYKDKKNKVHPVTGHEGGGVEI